MMPVMSALQTSQENDHLVKSHRSLSFAQKRSEALWLMNRRDDVGTSDNFIQ